MRGRRKKRGETRFFCVVMTPEVLISAAASPFELDRTLADDAFTLELVSDVESRNIFLGDAISPTSCCAQLAQSSPFLFQPLQAVSLSATSSPSLSFFDALCSCSKLNKVSLSSSYLYTVLFLSCQPLPFLSSPVQTLRD
mmetsp:Transcript_34624/g.89788  ORF Transcript_34624/g.89788 Transcript_34624/m.89788 type:complete len:140 (-) Transcript_34624:33-452(-)